MSLRVAALALLGLLLAPAAARAGSGGVLDLATTTSVRDSGLLDDLLPPFQARTGIQVRLVVVGSGAALRMGQVGDADVLVTHAPEGELALVREGRLVDRRPFMQNYFVIAGPPEDPAGIRSAPDAVEAMRRLAAARAPFASRGDDSGTHRRERALLRAAGLDPAAPWPGVLVTGAGMGQTLQVAGERRAYVLSDIGTFLRFRARVDLADLSPPADAKLRNLYSVSRPNPALYPPGHLNVDAALALADYLVAPETAARIAAFGHRPGELPLFTPVRWGEGHAGAEGSAPDAAP